MKPQDPILAAFLFDNLSESDTRYTFEIVFMFALEDGKETRLPNKECTTKVFRALNCRVWAVEAKMNSLEINEYLRVLEKGGVQVEMCITAFQDTQPWTES